MHQHTIETDGDARPRSAPTICIKGRRREVDIIGLPCKRRKTHVQAWLGDGVNATAFIVTAIQTKRVKHLRLPAAAVVHPAVTAPLPTGCRHVRRSEFQVERVAAEALLCNRIRCLQKPTLNLAALPRIRGTAIEENNRTTGSLLAKRRALALNPLERLNPLEGLIRL